MQLVAYGAQDVYLTGNPQITFWKVTYRRHTNFAMEAIEQSFNGMVDFGQRVTCVISRNGDLAYRTYLQVTLPSITPGAELAPGAGVTNGYARWLDYPGERLIKSVEIEIGGQRIDKQYGDWMHIWNQLTLTKEQEAGYFKMIGHTISLTYLTDPLFEANDVTCSTNATISGVVGSPRKSLPESTLYIPLQFWFCRNPGLALPLIALQYHEVKINLEIRPLSDCLFITDNIRQTNATLQGNKAGTTYVNHLTSGSIWVDYIFLDTDERRRMAQNSHEYLIEQLQFTGDESITGSTNNSCGQTSAKIKLLFNHPCKELIWVVQPCRFVECSGNNGSFYHLGQQPFNYTDTWDVLPDSYHPFGGPRVLMTDVGQNKRFIFNSPTTGELFENTAAWESEGQGTNSWNITSGGNGLQGVQPGGADAYTPETLTSATQYGVFTNPLVPTDEYQSLVSDAGSFVLADTAHKLHLWGNNPVYKANLQLNGQDRFAQRRGDYFNNVQPYQHHTRTPDTGINVYSFALRPEEHQPSGTCNFSRIDSAILQLDITQRTSDARVRVYAINYNVLRIMSGMGGLAYSN